MGFRLWCNFLYHSLMLVMMIAFVVCIIISICTTRVQLVGPQNYGSNCAAR